MDTTNFDDLVQNLEDGVESIAKSSLQDYTDQAKKDGQQLINDLRTNLESWTEEVASGALTKEDLEFLIQEEGALDEMVALKQAGLVEIRIDEFKNSLITMIVNTVFGFIKV